MLQTYETIFILQPELTEEEMESTVGTFEEILRAQKADLHKTEKWGKKRLAYRVRKHWEGFYVLLEYSSPASTVDELERRLRIHDNVIKWMSVKKDPRAAAEEERRAARMAKAQAQRAESGDGDNGAERGREARPGRHHEHGGSDAKPSVAKAAKAAPEAGGEESPKGQPVAAPAAEDSAAGTNEAESAKKSEEEGS